MSDPTALQTNHPSARPAWPERVFNWANQREGYLLLMGVALQLAVLGGVIAQRATPLVYGQDILLRVAPVDPRDLFRGDYVILSYEFSRIPPEGVVGLSASLDGLEDWAGTTVYVSLVPEPDGKHWRAEKFSIHRPSSGTYLRGTVTRWSQVDFGIESFYVQEGQGRDYERAVLDRKLSARVAVDADGRATLRALHIE